MGSMAIARPQAVLDALAAHQAAVDKILIAQGRAPGSIGGAHEVAILRHQQAEAELIALAEAAKAATSPARSVVSDTGVIGPSGIVGSFGNIGPSGLCGPSGCIAF